MKQELIFSYFGRLNLIFYGLSFIRCSIETTVLRFLTLFMWQRSQVKKTFSSEYPIYYLILRYYREWDVVVMSFSRGCLFLVVFMERRKITLISSMTLQCLIFYLILIHKVKRCRWKTLRVYCILKKVLNSKYLKKTVIILIFVQECSFRFLRNRSLRIGINSLH